MTQQTSPLITATHIGQVIATGSAFTPDALGVSYIDAIGTSRFDNEWRPYY